MQLSANLCLEKYLKKLIGKKDIEDALKRLDKLTQEEARMAAAENLRLSHIILNGTPSPVRYSGNIILNINTHVLGRWKGNEASGSTFGQQRR
jgi:hypothetical protein